AQSVDATARAADVAKQQLQNRRGANDLRAKGVLGPSDGVNDCARLLHVAVFANRSIEVRGFEELFLGDAGNALDHFRGIARVVFLQQLEHAIGVLQSEIEFDFFRQQGSGRRASTW